ncbi:hypothetical protein SETIT_8G201300v2 [Setaria italica]|uniref:Uncharacterized protein n=1 Tax=Setaria italica TaxID=4555 RepID=A0A368S9Y9_SETIT|nr:uncharacterized protein LOC101781443 [Setaria italica]RCV39163.1 hypothetical protein SETIT_8G201300v2 [Setaria italica]
MSPSKDIAPMSGEHEALSSNISSSSSIGLQDGSEDHAKVDLAAMTELSEIIVDEISSSNRRRQSSPREQIFRVPKEMLRAAGEGAYTPTFLSIGPYHHGATEEMWRNEQRKLVGLGGVVEEGGPSVLEYVKSIAAIEAKTRMCYEGDISMERGAFCKMLLLDGMQLICLLEFISHGQEAGDAIAEPSNRTATTCCDAVAVAVQRIISNKNQALCWRGQSQSQGGSQDCSQHANCGVKTRNLIRTLHDLMILENQIPFFVVERIYALRYANSPVTEYGQVRPAVMDLAWRAMTAILDGAPTAASHPVRDCKHLIDLCHVYLKPTCLQHKEPGTYGGRFRRATEYYEAGVKFRPWNADDTGSQRPSLDVKFSNGVLRMALQKVDEKTDYILRNVLAYEQRYATGDDCYVTAYVFFMSQLLGEPEDVALLARRGIMGHLLGSDAEVCALFRGLTNGPAFDPDGDHYLNWVGVALRSHCRHRRHQWRAWGRRHHFGNPWLVAAWVFGATTVLCTILQTVFTVLSYVNGAQPHNN